MNYWAHGILYVLAFVFNTEARIKFWVWVQVPPEL